MPITTRPATLAPITVDVRFVPRPPVGVVVAVAGHGH